MSETPTNQDCTPEFKLQLLQYLEVLKDKVAEMEMTAKESLNEKNFYVKKYGELEVTLEDHREREKNYNKMIGQLNIQNQSLTEKLDKKKVVV